jgi:hypothetical protein
MLFATVGGHDAWYTRAFHSLPRVGELLTALLAAIALAGIVRGIYRRTLGRRGDRYDRLRRLGTNAQLTFFTSVLGDPPAMRRTVEGQVTRFDENGKRYSEPRRYIEAVYIDRDFYVHVVADEDETVHTYSVTTRRKRFRPSFRPPGAFFAERPWPLRRWERTRYRVRRTKKVTLGKSRFADLDRPDNAASWVGAHTAHYFETHYLGNPGYYQTFIYSINDTGAWAYDAPFNATEPDMRWGFSHAPVDPKLALAEAAALAHAGHKPDEEEIAELLQDDPPLPDALQRFRRQARINTYTVVGPEFFLDDYPGAGGRIDEYPIIFGANSGRVRTIGEE